MVNGTWVWAAVVLAGCYGPTIAEDVPCGPDRECPAGQTCDIDGRCRSELLPDAATDTDGDGVFDGEDNCVMVANPQQSDEDGDTVGNLCDNCPHLANLDQAATIDDDDFGDACDNAASVRQTLIVFEGFDAPPPDWTIPATWRIAGGQLVADARTTTGVATWNTSTPDAVIVVTEGRMMQSTGNAGVVVRASDTSYYRCSITPSRGELVRHNGSMTTTLGVTDLGAPDLSEILIALAVGGSSINCIVQAGTAMAEQIPQTDPLPLGGPLVGIRASGVDARFAYFLAYTQQ